MNKTTAGIIVALVVIGSAVAVVALNKENDKPAKNSSSGMNANKHNDDDGRRDEEPSRSAQETNMITYKGFEVAQKSITVKKGTTVTWTNEDDAMHDVTPDTETADFKASELFGKGESHKVTFNTVGSYPYHCSPHPYMKGMVEVIE